MPILNLGFLAHVDAGKTSLTERVLYETAVTQTIGRVDSGNTQTDTLELERQRGISIRSAVVSFQLGDLKVNLIDTPGHADFIAEVERALSALDGVVILISAVEGVQPQTRKLVRAVRSLGLPMLILINKIDRIGARDTPLLNEIEARLGLRLMPMNRPRDPGSTLARVEPYAWDDTEFSTRLIDRLTESGDEFLRAWLQTEGHLSRRAIRKELRRQVKQGEIVPVYFGSAMTGAGIDLLLQGIRDLLPRAPEAADDPASGVVFKIQRDISGEKLVYLRLLAGSLRIRQQIGLRAATGDANHEARITGIDRFDRGACLPAPMAMPGDIVRLHGLREARIGDAIGPGGHRGQPTTFAPPALESVVTPLLPHQVTALYAALQQLAEQDPLIEVHRDQRHAEISVRLFGEVQKEVIAAMLESDYGIEVDFAESQAICVEHPTGCGEASEIIGHPANPFAAGLALRIEPGAQGSGVAFHRPSGALPLAFYKAIEETVYETLTEGLHGWQVTDCVVTVTYTAYWSPVTVAGDFRKLTPLAVMAALRQAGTRVLEPVQRFSLHVPGFAVGDALATLIGLRGLPEETVDGLEETIITGVIPSATVRLFEQKLPGLSAGEGVFASEFCGYAPVTGAPPRRPRTDFNPLNRKQYLALVSQA
jgi:ribosomal protection tetracycline resistance protein